MSEIKVASHEHCFGACITGVNLATGLTEDQAQTIRAAWLEHQVVYFPDQPLSHPQLETFTRSFGDFGHDPYVKAIDGHQNILEVRREPDEAITPFGGSWHSDWSFQETPPAATILHAKVVPPIGGDTHYADGVRAYEKLDPVLREEIDELVCVHSARRPYSHEGYRRGGGPERSMTILPSDKAWETRDHPLVRTHPENGRKVLWINPVYSISIRGLTERESEPLLKRLLDHALQERFIYRHKWSADMLTMWDNRSVQHCAQGGYDGHLRVMHRTTVAGDRPH
ncbi:MAG: TauD/TfdA family dioxygenase [Pseudomonadota bacterium]